ncbi:MAG: B12-binding domain-containing radical SAM protein [Thermodesulfobacteriota bacterium]
MKALLVNPGYPQTFWSFNRVLEMLGKKVLDPPLGLLTVAALLPDDWELRLVELTVRPISQQEWDFCDIVLVTGMVNQSSGILDTVREAKKRGKTVVVGGPMVFHFPEEVLKAGADIVVKGEAEDTIGRLLEALSKGETGLVITPMAPADLSKSPAPRFDLLDLDNYVAMAVQFSRGCPFHCEFCDITLMLGRVVRTKTPEQILHELDVLYKLGWRREVFFVDDNFVGNPRRTRELLTVLVPWMEERGHPFDFHTQASVNLAAQPEVMELMGKAGFFKVFLGIETPDEESLRQTKKLQNAAVDLDEVCRKINKAGLQVQAGCIIGFDHERPGADQRLIDFAIRNHIPEMFITMLQAGPGTDLWKRLETEGRLLFRGVGDHLGSQTGLLNFVPTRPLAQIVDEFLRLYDVLYDPEFYLDRAYNHYRAMGPCPVKKRFLMPFASEIRTVAITVFRQGIVYSSRAKFWRYLLGGLLRFPTRLRHFFTACVVAEHYYEYRRTIRDHLTQELRKAEAGSPPPPSIPVQAEAYPRAGAAEVR